MTARSLPLYCSFLQDRVNCGQWLEWGRNKVSPGRGSCLYTVNAKELLASTYSFSHLVDEGHTPHPLHFCLTQSEEGKKSSLNEAV